MTSDFAKIARKWDIAKGLHLNFLKKLSDFQQWSNNIRLSLIWYLAENN
jgi:hypothetical protein